MHDKVGGDGGDARVYMARCLGEAARSVTAIYGGKWLGWHGKGGGMAVVDTDSAAAGSPARSRARKTITPEKRAWLVSGRE